MRQAVSGVRGTDWEPVLFPVIDANTERELRDWRRKCDADEQVRKANGASYIENGVLSVPPAIDYAKIAANSAEHVAEVKRAKLRREGEGA